MKLILTMCMGKSTLYNPHKYCSNVCAVSAKTFQGKNKDQTPTACVNQIILFFVPLLSQGTCIRIEKCVVDWDIKCLWRPKS